MPSIVDIVNLALDEIKARATVTSVFPSDGSLAANVASRQFWLRLDALARSANWNTHRMQLPLAVLKAAQGTPENVNGSTLPIPPAPWLYEYAIPTNPIFLKARKILPLLGSGSSSVIPLTTGGNAVVPEMLRGGNVKFQVASDLDAYGNQITVILTNWYQAQLVYTARVTDPNRWDPLFTQAAVGVLASYFCLPVNGDKTLASGLIARAKEIIINARVIDGDENPERHEHVPDWIAARSGWSWNGGATVGDYGYDAMSFGDGSAI